VQAFAAWPRQRVDEGLGEERMGKPGPAWLEVLEQAAAQQPAVRFSESVVLQAGEPCSFDGAEPDPKHRRRIYVGARKPFHVSKALEDQGGPLPRRALESPGARGAPGIARWQSRSDLEQQR
jgi:hypothetical protein